MQIHTVRLSQETAFGQNKVEGGAIVATISIEHSFIDLSQLLSMVQYRQATIETTEIDDDPVDDLVDESAISEPSEVDDEESDDEAGADENSGGSGAGAGQESASDVPPLNHDPDSIESLGLDESLTEAIKANKILTVAALREFIDQGNDLVDLDKIGTVRAKKIIAALESRS